MNQLHGTLAFALLSAAPACLHGAELENTKRYFVAERVIHDFSDGTTETVNYAGDLLADHYYIKFNLNQREFTYWSFNDLQLKLHDDMFLSFEPDTGPLNEFELKRLRRLGKDNWWDSWATTWTETTSALATSWKRTYVGHGDPVYKSSDLSTTVTVEMDVDSSRPLSIRHEFLVNSKNDFQIGEAAYSLEWREGPPREIRMVSIPVPGTVVVHTSDQDRFHLNMDPDSGTTCPAAVVRTRD